MRLFGVVLVMLVGCGDDGGGATADAAPPDADPCPALWSSNVSSPPASVTIGGGTMRLSSTDTPNGSAIEVWQGGLTGDFDASFAFTAWTAAGTGAFLQLGVGEDIAVQTRFAVAGIGTFPTVGVGAAEQPDDGDPAGELVATAEVSGTLHARRAGSTLMVTAMTSDATADITLTDFSATLLKLGVQLGSNMGTLSGDTTVDITEFTITGGGGSVQADTFDCDSLITP